jgi:hypothetical protein
MADKRQLELYLLRLVPHTLRDDFMTVGVVVVESGGEFVDARFTRDWKRVECFAPEIELEHLERLEAAVRGELKGIRSRADLLGVLESRFGTEFDVGPVKGIEAMDPAAEMNVLVRDYLAPMAPVERARRLGRLGIVGRMEEGFAEAGVLGLLSRDIVMTEFTGEHDPFKVDFGFRVGNSLKMFHALALNLSREPAVTLAYRYARIQEGLRQKNEQAVLTAVISEDAARRRDEVTSGIGMLRANEILVRDVSEMRVIGEEVRREIRGS